MKKIFYIALLALAPLLALPSAAAAQADAEANAVEDSNLEASVQDQPNMTQHMQGMGTDMMNQNRSSDTDRDRNDGDRDGRDWDRDNNNRDWDRNSGGNWDRDRRDNDWDRDRWNRGGSQYNWGRIYPTHNYNWNRPFSWDRTNWKDYNWNAFNWRYYPSVTNVLTGRVLESSYNSLLVLADNGRVYLVGASNARITNIYGYPTSIFSIRDGDRIVVSGVVRNSIIYATRIIDLTAYSYWR